MPDLNDPIPTAANKIRDAVNAGDRARAEALLRGADTQVIEWLRVSWASTGPELVELVALEHMRRLTAGS